MTHADSKPTRGFVQSRRPVARSKGLAQLTAIHKWQQTVSRDDLTQMSPEKLHTPSADPSSAKFKEQKCVDMGPAKSPGAT